MTRYNDPSNNDIVEVLAFIVLDIPDKKAILVTQEEPPWRRGEDGKFKNQYWVPRSQIDSYEEHSVHKQEGKGGDKILYRIHMKRWIAEKSDFSFEEA